MYGIPINLSVKYPDNCDSLLLEINVCKYSGLQCSHEFTQRNFSKSHSSLSLWGCRFHSPISPTPLQFPSMDKVNPSVP